MITWKDRVLHYIRDSPTPYIGERTIAAAIDLDIDETRRQHGILGQFLDRTARRRAAREHCADNALLGDDDTVRPDLRAIEQARLSIAYA